MDNEEYNNTNTYHISFNNEMSYLLIGGVILLFILKFKSFCKFNNNNNLKNNLKKTLIIPENKILDECCICLCKLNNGEQIIKLNCNHYYHFECMEKCLNKGFDFCPYCRNEII
tara:strand:+ start:2686 stop:3027 length:342 start_codon:yes stop_codon:yes gene_type:complete